MDGGVRADDLIARLGLVPLEGEGGRYRETYRLAAANNSGLPAATAIYYLLTPDTFSELHRLPSDELYHFYLGDPVELLTLAPEGDVGRHVLGPDVLGGMAVQLLVPGGTWQGSRLREDGRFALMGTTMTPGFRAETYRRGDREELSQRYPSAAMEIKRLTRAGQEPVAPGGMVD